MQKLATNFKNIVQLFIGQFLICGIAKPIELKKYEIQIYLNKQ